MNHEKWMKLAIREAEQAFEREEVPVGALVIKAGHIIGKGYNQRETLKDPTAHAEIIALTAAANYLGDWRLDDCVIYVTKEPCAMCAGGITNARIKKLVFGCYDEEEGCCGSLYQLPNDPRFSHRVGVRGGVLEEECRELLMSFFRSRRNSQ